MLKKHWIQTVLSLGLLLVFYLEMAWFGFAFWKLVVPTVAVWLYLMGQTVGLNLRFDEALRKGEPELYKELHSFRGSFRWLDFPEELGDPDADDMLTEVRSYRCMMWLLFLSIFVFLLVSLINFG